MKNNKKAPTLRAFTLPYDFRNLRRSLRRGLRDEAGIVLFAFQGYSNPALFLQEAFLRHILNQAVLPYTLLLSDDEYQYVQEGRLQLPQQQKIVEDSLRLKLGLYRPEYKKVFEYRFPISFIVRTIFEVIIELKPSSWEVGASYGVRLQPPHITSHRKLADVLKRLRQDTKMTKQQLANRIGADVRNIRQLEKGYLSPQLLPAFDALAVWYGKRPLELLHQLGISYYCVGNTASSALSVFFFVSRSERIANVRDIVHIIVFNHAVTAVLNKQAP